MATKKAKTKKVAAKKSAPKKKLDGKALAAKRKPRDSMAQFIKDELLAGKSDVDKIVERAKAEFKGGKPTPGYVRWIAKQIGKEKQVASSRGVAEKKPAKAKAKAKKPAKDAGDAKPSAPSSELDPAS